MIKIYDLKGLFPRVGSVLQDQGSASTCENATVTSGYLEPAFYSPTSAIFAGGGGSWPTSYPGLSLFKWRLKTGGDFHYGGSVYNVVFGGGTYKTYIQLNNPHEITTGDQGYVNNIYDYVTAPPNVGIGTLTVVDSTKVYIEYMTNDYNIGDKVDVFVISHLWLVRTNRASFAKAYLKKDGNEVVYVTESGAYPRRVYGSTTTSVTYNASIGVPAGPTAPTLVITSAGTGDLKATNYVYTRVNSLGQESAPSPVSATINIGLSHNVTVTCNVPSPTTQYPDHAKTNVYRSVTSGAGTAYQYLGQITTGSTLVDTLNDSSLGEVLTTTGYAEPRTDMRGIISVGNGVMAGYSGNLLCLCEPYQTHAWPTKYERPVDYDIVGISAIGTNIVILTKEDVFIAYGSHSSNYVIKKVGINQGCVSGPSIAKVADSGVVYASTNGLMLVSDAGVTSLTDDILDLEDWYNHGPSTIIGAVHNNKYIGSYRSPGGGRKCFILDPANLHRGIYYSDRSFFGAYSDPASGEMFYIDDDRIRSFQGTRTDERDAYTWASKTHREGYPINYTAAEVLCDEYSNITFQLYAENDAGVFQLKHTQVVTDRKPFRMPSGYKSSAYRIKLTGKSIVQSVNLATSIEELSRL